MHRRQHDHGHRLAESAAAAGLMHQAMRAIGVVGAGFVVMIVIMRMAVIVRIGQRGVFGGVQRANVGKYRPDDHAQHQEHQQAGVQEDEWPGIETNHIASVGRDTGCRNLETVIAATAPSAVSRLEHGSRPPRQRIGRECS